VRFPIAALPTATVLAALLVHAVVFLAVLVILALSGDWPGLRLLALPYYVAAFLAFTVPLGLLLALANTVTRDTAEITAAAVSLLFWATPIVWPQTLIPERWQWLLYFNPAAYLTDGYRRVLARAGDSWIDLPAAAAFWAGCALLALVAWYVYSRLRLFLSDFL
jgi:ABC-type polysaccharide/polyol phosphate export permease